MDSSTSIVESSSLKSSPVESTPFLVLPDDDGMLSPDDLSSGDSRVCGRGIVIFGRSGGYT
jgi:hypothetical protein